MRASVKSIGHFESATALVGGVTLHYWLGGAPTGPPILLWHGFLGTSYSWHKVMPLLVEAGYRAVSYTHLDVYKRQAIGYCNGHDCLFCAQDRAERDDSCDSPGARLL